MHRESEARLPRLQTMPKKQGANFSLGLCKEVGAYLPKDLTADHTRSTKLIRSKQAFEQHVAMAISIQQMRKEFKEAEAQTFARNVAKLYQGNTTLLSTSLEEDNLKPTERAGLLQLECNSLLDEVRALARKRAGFKKEFQELQSKVNEANDQCLACLMPAMKQFHKSIRTACLEGRSQGSRVQREIGEIRREHTKTLQVILQAHQQVLQLASRLRAVQEGSPDPGLVGFVDV